MAGIQWTNDEVNYLKNNYQNMSCEEIARHLGRTTRSVQHRFGQLDLKRYIPKVGDKIHRLTIIETFFKNDGRQNKQYGKCICECGKEVIVRLTDLVGGSTKSCGCWKSDRAAANCIQRNYKHGKADLTNNRLFRIWCAMKSRCYTQSNTYYKNWGGRGIVVCNDWKKNFESFEYWALSNGYNDKLSIDRIDTNGNYEPSNCKWSTMTEQAQNKRSNIHITAFGETKVLAEWCRDIRCVVKPHTLKYRIDRGWKPETAIVTPILDMRCLGEPKS